MNAPMSLSQTVQAVASGSHSAAAVLEVCIARIEATESRVNAFTSTRFNAARAQAARVDAQRARGEPLGPLAGVPFAVKNLFDIAGLPTLAGSKIEGDRTQRMNLAMARARRKPSPPPSAT